MATLKKAEAKKLAAKFIIEWLTNDVTAEGRLDESEAYTGLTASGKSKVETAINEFKALIAKKAKLYAE
jgi:hypothetical protein